MTAYYEPVFRDNKLHVMPAKCSTCIFHPGNRMHLRSGRVKEMVDGCITEGVVIPCHKTTFQEAPVAAICRGFFDSYSEQIPLLQIAKRMNVVTYDGKEHHE